MHEICISLNHLSTGVSRRPNISHLVIGVLKRRDISHLKTGVARRLDAHHLGISVSKSRWTDENRTLAKRHYLIVQCQQFSFSSSFPITYILCCI